MKRKCDRCGVIFETDSHFTNCPSCNNIFSTTYLTEEDKRKQAIKNYNYDLKQLTKEILISISQNTNLCFNNDTNKHDYNGLVEHSSKIAEAYLKWSEKQ